MYIRRSILTLSALFMFSQGLMAEDHSQAVVKNVTIMQRPDSQIVDIAYTLENQAAIITLSIETNSIPLPGSAVTHLTGDVSKLIQPGRRTIAWNAGVNWPGHRADQVRARITAWSEKSPPLYSAVDLIQGPTTNAAYNIYYYPSEDAVPNGVTDDLYKTTRILMRKVGPTGPNGFRMGSPLTESFRSKERENPHTVILTKAYYLAVYETTQSQWELVMKDNSSRPAHFHNDLYWTTRPVENISYWDIREIPHGSQPQNDPNVNWPDNRNVNSKSFMGKIRARTKIDSFDLPTEAQWEYACRAGTDTALYDGTAQLENPNTDPRLNLLARYLGNSGTNQEKNAPADLPVDQGTAKVGSYLPNAWGFYDMLGNVREVCLDYWNPSVPPRAEETDPKGPASASEKEFRVCRGGAYFLPSRECRSAAKEVAGSHWQLPSNGFRLCRELP